MNFIKNTIQKGVVVLTLLMMLTSLAEANQVGFVESRVSVIAGQSITLHLIGSGFSSGPESVSFSMAWDDSLLKYSGNEVANPPWDSLTVTPPNGGSGLLDVVLLGNARQFGFGRTSRLLHSPLWCWMRRIPTAH